MSTSLILSSTCSATTRELKSILKVCDKIQSLYQTKFKVYVRQNSKSMTDKIQSILQTKAKVCDRQNSKSVKDKVQGM